MKKNDFLKKMGCLALSAACALSLLSGCSSPAQTTDSVKTIQILATSDTHGFFDTYDYTANKEETEGSLTQISYKVNELRKENPNTLLLDNGDALQGNMADLFIDDDVHPMYAAMNEMNYDVCTLGNHEFNYGPEYVEKFVQEPNATFLCGNVYKPDGTRLADPYTVKEIDGVRIGIIGMTTPNILRWDGSKMPDWKVTNPIDETRAAIDEMEANHAADVYIALCHMGEEQEYGYGDNVTDLANACPELTAIVAGHTHEVVNCDKISNTIITQPSYNGKGLSQIQIKVKDDGNGGYEVIDATSQVIDMNDQPVDTTLATTLKPYHERGVEEMQQQIGTLINGPLVPESKIPGVSQSLLEDTPLDDLIENVLIYYAQPHVPEGKKLVASCALTKQDANLQSGPIRMCDINNIYQFNNTLYLLKMSGAQLKDYMEWSAGFYNQYQDGDVTISFSSNRPYYNFDTFTGLNYEINIANEVGSRIENLTYSDGTPVDDQDEVYLATTDYRTNTILNTELFKDNPCEIIYDSTNEQNGSIHDMIVSYICNIKGGVIDAQAELTPNWKITGTNFDEFYQNCAYALLADGVISIDNNKDKIFNTKSFTQADIEKYREDYPQYFM